MVPLKDFEGAHARPDGHRQRGQGRVGLNHMDLISVSISAERDSRRSLRHVPGTRLLWRAGALVACAARNRAGAEYMTYAAGRDGGASGHDADKNGGGKNTCDMAHGIRRHRAALQFERVRNPSPLGDAERGQMQILARRRVCHEAPGRQD